MKLYLDQQKDHRFINAFFIKICNNDKLNLRNIIIPGRKQKKLHDGRVLPEIPKIKLCANPLYYPLLLFRFDNKLSIDDESC